MRGTLPSFVAIGLLSFAMAALCTTSLPAQDLLSENPAGLAPGVLTTIPPELDRKDTTSIHDIVELRADASLKRNPSPMIKSPTLYEMAKEVNFRHDVWCLELSFKPLRMVFVDIPQANGKMQRKLIWYPRISCAKHGCRFESRKTRGRYTFETVSFTPGELQFIPHFVLSSRDRNREGEPIEKAYLNRIIPAAIDVIKRRERVPGELLNSAEMASMKLPVESGRSVMGQWGVATWEDVDPQIDFLTVEVSGLTNAYRWEDPAGKYRLGDPPGKGRKLVHKKLQLIFWRPGDTVAEEEGEIRYGPAPGQVKSLRDGRRRCLPVVLSVESTGSGEAGRTGHSKACLMVGSAHLLVLTLPWAVPTKPRTPLNCNGT